MKLLHTSDWHIGKTLKGRHRLDEQAAVLGEIVSLATEHEVDAILIALPTPLSKQREPDLSIVLEAGAAIGKRLRPGQLVVLESTTYPGTTREELRPVLERESGLVAGTDFHLAFSPERVDPGRVDWTTKTVPKVVGGIDDASTEAAAALYLSAVDNQLRHATDEPSIGLILCKERNRLIVEYALRDSSKPLGVATYQLLPDNLKADLPTPEQLEAELRIDDQEDSHVE